MHAHAHTHVLSESTFHALDVVHVCSDLPERAHPSTTSTSSALKHDSCLQVEKKAKYHISHGMSSGLNIQAFIQDSFVGKGGGDLGRLMRVSIEGPVLPAIDF